MRIRDQCPCERNPLALAARDFSGPAQSQMVDAEGLQDGSASLLAFLPVDVD